ncbi:MAG TPA: hypothetical protein VE172_17915 [Stackebrandtia sp.]|jgi:hypothetical protein|uniref:hypothetical protein n=1 Tax=Stackebrandtia sp. TaxID=2023065 RepID=UPI002D51C24E|nr:hypothetical protein [Stackebrandtia sp.]HZE40682.1 hypothetical protein [Stackebrandtia sp.]
MVDNLDARNPLDTPPTWRDVALRMLAMASLLAAVVHFSVTGEHFAEYWAYGAFMLVGGFVQLGWSVAAVARPSKGLLVSGAVINAAIVAVYVVTRTVGDLVGPGAGQTEPIGLADTVTTACEALIVVGSVALALGTARRPVRRRTAAVVTISAATATVVLLSMSLMGGGEMSEDSEMDAAAAVSLPTHSPAGPVTMPDADMRMENGMAMASDKPCTKAPTAAQQRAAVKLVNDSWAGSKKYRNLATAKADGYRSLTPSGAKVVHYINATNYRATVEGRQQTLDPSRPQSLVYANTSRGAVLVAAMYIASPRDHGAPAQPGGCLTQWHVHTNLCFDKDMSVVGVAKPSCPADSRQRRTPPMLHIWFAPVPGGPTAVDASPRQVVRAAERVGGTDHKNETA